MPSLYNRSERLENIADRWNRVEHLWNGTDSLKEQGRMFLPQEPHESLDNYRIRLNRSVLFNKYKKTVETSVGKVFTKPVIVDGLPTIIEDDLSNIDSEGSTFNVFAKKLCTDAIHFGIGYIVVDYPVSETVTTPTPYWVRIDPLSIVDIQVDFIEGQETLTKFAFVERVADYTAGTFEIGNDVNDETQTKILYLDEDMKPQFVVLDKLNNMIAQGPIVNGAGQAMSSLPVVPVYGEKVEPYVGTPVLMDLADLNLAHWQDYSDIRNINHITSVPMLLLKGQQEQYDENGNTKQIVISPNSVITISDPSGDAKWIEHSGSSIGTNLDMLKHLEDKMSVMGLEMTVPTQGNETATGRVIDQAQAHSKLKCIALDLETSLENALSLHAEYVGLLNTDIKVILNLDFANQVNTADMTTIISLYKDGIIDAGQVLEEAKSRTILSTDEVTVPTAPQNNNLNEE